MKSGRRAISSARGVLAFAATGEGRSAPVQRRRCCTACSQWLPSLDQVSTEARPLIERCLAKTPRGGPPPTACSPRWAPSSRRRTGCPNRSSARSPGIPLHVPRPPRLLRPLRRSGRLRRSGSSASQRHRPRRPAPQRRYRAGKACSWRPQAISRPAPRGACRRLRIHILPGRSINSPRQAGGTGRGASRGGRCWNHWRRYRGSRHSQYRGDRFHRAFAYSNSVPGGTDVLSGGILARDAGPGLSGSASALPPGSCPRPPQRTQHRHRPRARPRPRAPTRPSRRVPVLQLMQRYARPTQVQDARQARTGSGVGLRGPPPDRLAN